MNLAEGTIVRVDLDLGPVYASVEAERRGKIMLVTSDDRRFPVPAARLTLVSPFRLPPQADRSPQDQLRELAAAVDDTVSQVDLATVWELVELGDSVGAEDIAELCFDDVDAVAFFATVRALDEDSTYFRKKGEAYLPRRPADIEAITRRAQVVAEREAAEVSFRGDMIEHLRCQGGGPLARPAEGVGWNLIELLLDYASQGDGFARKDEAKSLLRELSVGAGRALGRGPLAAFRVLLELGAVGHHENMALRRHDIRKTFSKDVAEAAEQLAGTVADETQSVVGFDEHAVFTVDDSTTMDLDDALHVAFDRDGSFEVGIHITDVGQLVRPGSQVDRAARRRGSSLYLPTGVIPMIPVCLSEQRLSLVEGERRRSLSFLVRFSETGEELASDVVLGSVEVSRRLSYTQADAILEDEADPLHRALKALLTISEQLEARRFEDGATMVDLPEVKVAVLNDEIEIHRLDESRSRSVIAEMMVLAGRVAAEFCLTHHIPSVYRVQPPIGARDAYEKAAMIEDPLARAMEQVRYMRRGELRTVPERHHGLGLPAYCQVTSPLRRYADLVVNYQLRRYLTGEELSFDDQTIVDVANRAERAAVACAHATRESVRYWLLEYLSRQPQTIANAVVLQHDPGDKRSIPVVLETTMLRGSVKASYLRPGDKIQVRVVKADSRNDQLQLEAL